MRKALVGNGGHAREEMSQMGEHLTRFVDHKYWDGLDPYVKPLREFDPEEWELMVAVAESSARFDIVSRLPSNTRYFSFIHQTALIMDSNVEIGYGSFIGAYSILTTNIKIGNHALLNRGNHIGHDCEIGDFFSAMPGSIVSGNVKIFDCVYLGNNSTIKEKISINSHCTVGMNAAVIKNINEIGTYVGVPAKKINR
jgi:sugar O-acyltransferase (sialic acid O-acetyltransferase NeuD family)